MADTYDWSGAESQLKQKSGQYYDPSMLEDLKRNTSYGSGDAGPSQSSVDDWTNRLANKASLRGSNEVNSTYQANGQGGTTTGPTGNVNYGNGGSAGGNMYGGGSGGGGDMAGLLRQMLQQQQDTSAANKQRGDALYGQLSARAGQSLNIDRNDPIIRGQADSYAANMDRERRNYLSDTAERSGQFANLQGERRMTAEHTGQAQGQFEAQLMGRELTARRDEIQQALSGMQGQLSAEQQMNLQKQLGLLNNSIQQQAANTGQYNAVTGRTGMQNNYDIGQQQVASGAWNNIQNQYQMQGGF
jgi:hypothetical protein